MSHDDRRDARGDEAQSVTSADPVRNFTITVDERIRALTIGAPAFALRKRRIEDLEAMHVATLVELHDKLAAKGAADIDGALEKRAASIDLSRMNDLVKTHNRWYPVEANLPMDRDGNWLVYGRIWEPETPFTAARLLAAARARIAARDASDEDAP